MAKFIQVQSPENHSYYINVDTIGSDMWRKMRRPRTYLRYTSLANAICQSANRRQVLLVELVPWRTRPTSSNFDRRALTNGAGRLKPYRARLTARRGGAAFKTAWERQAVNADHSGRI